MHKGRHQVDISVVCKESAKRCMPCLQDLLNDSVGSISSLILNRTSSIMGPQLRMWQAVSVPRLVRSGGKNSGQT